MKTQRMLIGLLILGLLLALPASPGPLSVRATAPARPGAAHLTSDQAIAAAVNDLEATADGYRLRHPRHTATFTPEGVQFTPRGGGPAWAWELTAVMAGDAPLPRVRVGAVRPTSERPGVVAYPRGGLVEQYLARQDSLEQQFVAPRPLPLGGADLVIAGTVRSAGAFEATAEGWRWSTTAGAVRLGSVRVYDASGRDLPATMRVTATGTRIVVDGAALARAAYPLTIDPEIGANDFRISFMGHDTQFDAESPAVAYNPLWEEYLVVWSGDDNTGPLVDGENEIFGQFVDAVTGARVSTVWRLSDVGPDGNTAYGAYAPAVAYNSTDHEYLVVWYGDDDTAPLVDEEYEIFCRRLHLNGHPIGSSRRISSMGPDGNAGYSAYVPAVAYNSTANQYLVVWLGDDNTAPLVHEEYEIWGQRVDGATGAEIGGDFRLSDMGPDGNAAYDADVPAVAYNSTEDEYLVVWRGDDNTAPLVDEECEIYGQRVDGATGAEIGGDFRISDMGPDGNTAYDAIAPAVVYNSTGDEYLVVWHGDDDAGTLENDEWEIYGQRVDGATGAEIGANDFCLSDMGPDGNSFFDAGFPAIAYNSAEDEYLVVWVGEDDTAPLVDNEQEVFGQRVEAATGAEIGANDFRLSDMGPDGNTAYGAFTAAVVYNSTGDEYLVVWAGDDNTAPLVLGEYEIFGQRVGGASGAEIGANDLRLSDMGSDVLFDAFDPAVAYNSQANEYLVVWQGDDNTFPLVNGEYEIFGQRVNAVTGAEIGGHLRLSDMGPDRDIAYGAQDPAVAYSSTENEYLVVWAGDDNAGALVNGEYEIYGQRVEATTGTQIGGDLRLSEMGPDGNANYDAYAPAVAYNPTSNEYLVVWRGDNDTGALVDEEFEIYGQRLNAATGAELTADLRLSDMGPDGNANYDAWEPTVAYNSTSNQYLVVWRGDDDTPPLVDEEFEVYGQRLNGASGVPLGANDFRLSDMGPDGDADYDAYEPAVAYDPTDNQYLVVWRGDDDTPPLVDGEYEIFGQRVDGATATELGGDVRLSDMGPDGNVNYRAAVPAVAYSSRDSEYLVIWSGDDNTGGLVDNENEIWGQRVDAATGSEIDTDFRLSDMGPDGEPVYDARETALACNSTGNDYLVVWSGDDNTLPLVDEEFEIFGQRFAGHYWLYLPLVMRAH